MTFIFAAPARRTK